MDFMTRCMSRFGWESKIYGTQQIYNLKHISNLSFGIFKVRALFLTFLHGPKIWVVYIYLFFIKYEYPYIITYIPHIYCIHYDFFSTPFPNQNR